MEQTHDPGKVSLACSGSISVLTTRRTQVAWEVPNKAWLHLGTYYSVFDTELLTMEVVD